MIQRASSVGELASRLLSLGRPGTVTRVFERSAYIKTGSDFFLLLWVETRSPMTVNVIGETEGFAGLKAGQSCELSRSGIRAGEVTITTRKAKTYRSSILERRMIALPPVDQLSKGIAILRTLYEASSHGPTLPADSSFRRFAEKVLIPFATNGTGQTLRFDHFLEMVGRGGGFTPAGDDFTAGFTATFNYVARSEGTNQIVVPRRLLASKTIPESAAILFYSSRGYVDEGLERLILNSTTEGGPRFYGDLTSLASRGHTSGLDMSLGVLLAEASISDAAGRALEACLGALWSD